MSYILDALKRSEQERKLGNLPDISSDHHLLQKTHDKNVLLYAILAIMFVLVITLSILVFYYLKTPSDIERYSNDKNSVSELKTTKTIKIPITKSASTYPKEVQETASANSAISASGAEIIRPNQERRESLHKQQQQDLKKDAELKREYQDIFQKKTPIIAEQENINTHLNSEELLVEDDFYEEVESNSALDEPNWNDYESIAALSPALKQQIPSIKVSTHIFSSVKSFRKVTVNGFSVGSGTEISDGLIVQHILEDGVIFSFQGVYFRMKALEEWEG